jgi:hypothetical protein
MVAPAPRAFLEAVQGGRWPAGASMGASSIAKGDASMPRHLYHAAAATLCAGALAASAAALAPAMPVSGLRALVDSLMVLRDGHGAVPLPHPDDPSRRTR